MLYFFTAKHRDLIYHGMEKISLESESEDWSHCVFLNVGLFLKFYEPKFLHLRE